MSKLALSVALVVALLLAAGGSTYASPPGVWVKYSGNPVLTPGAGGSWDDGDVLSVEVVQDGTQYRMWYSADRIGSSPLQIGYATSTDGIAWVRYANNPVLTVGTEGSWDDSQVSAPAVVFDGLVWKMWYSGLGPDGFRIGYATSPDGIHWTKYVNNPVLFPGSSGDWDGVGVFSPCVLFNDGVYHMWYGGRDASRIQIGYATSMDGIHWTKPSNNPVLAVGAAGTWDSQDVVSPSVILSEGQYHMWYQGSVALGDKQRDPGDIASLGTAHSSLESRTAFGHATSLDGVGWTKDPVNPVLSPGPAGSWDAYTIHYPSVIVQRGFLRMWYHGRSALESPLQVGYAEAKVAGNSVFLPIVVKW
jgi:predicted GH43/DUF377 family glycosyl hydrolase